MADRTIVLAQNKRHAVRGLTVVNPQQFSAYQEDDDDLTYIVDMSSYLDGATISSVTRTPNGVTVSNTSKTTTRITQRLKGFGYVDFKVTSSSGDVEEFRLTIQPRASRVSSQIAQVPTEMPLATTSTSDPTASDDTTRNFYPGSVWINTVSLNEFRCISNAQGAAVWRHVPRVLAQSGAASAITGTLTETALATITVPAGAMGPNGIINIIVKWLISSSGNTKTARVRFSGIAGSTFTSIAQTTNTYFKTHTVIANRNSAASQVGDGGNGTGGWAPGTGADTTSTVDTSAATTIVITGQLANTGDSIAISSFDAILTRPDIT